jgi:hypothetical protein
MLLYFVLSSGPRGSPTTRDKGSVVDRGMGADLHFVIPSFLSKSDADFSCVNNKPLEDLFTLMPKK